MTDPDADLLADLRYIIAYADRLRSVVEQGHASSADVGCAQRLAQLAAIVLRKVEDRQGE